MAQITATPHYGGIALVQFTETLQTSDDLPAEAIGEVVARAMQKAVRNRYQAIGTPLSIVVTFGD
jgi:hypothetical protein